MKLSHEELRYVVTRKIAASVILQIAAGDNDIDFDIVSVGVLTTIDEYLKPLDLPQEVSLILVGAQRDRGLWLKDQ